MRSFAIYQIIATLAALALFAITTEVSALPVRGALGNLNTRARIARRANNNAAALGKRFKIATKQFNGAALPANPKQKLLKNVKEVEKNVLHKRRDAGVIVDAVPSPISSPASQATAIEPGASGMVLGLIRPSAVVQQNIVAPAALAAQQDSSSSSSSSEESESDSSSADQEAIYQSYVDSLNDSISATATVTVTSTAVVDAQNAVAPTNFKVAAVVPVQSSAPATPDAQAIYNSYVAQMNAAAASAS